MNTVVGAREFLLSRYGALAGPTLALGTYGQAGSTLYQSTLPNGRHVYAQYRNDCYGFLDRTRTNGPDLESIT